MKKVLKKIWSVFEALLPLILVGFSVVAFIDGESIKGFLFLIIANQFLLSNRLEELYKLFGLDDVEGEKYEQP